MINYSKKIKIININNGGIAIFVDCFVNNEKATLLIDTGASNSIFDANASIFSNIKLKENKAECHSINSSDISIMSGQLEKLKIGKFSISIKSAIFSPLDYVNNIFLNNNINIISGILGSDFLKKYKAIINFEKKSLILKK